MSLSFKMRLRIFPAVSSTENETLFRCRVTISILMFGASESFSSPSQPSDKTHPQPLNLTSGKSHSLPLFRLCLLYLVGIRTEKYTHRNKLSILQQRNVRCFGKQVISLSFQMGILTLVSVRYEATVYG